MGEVWRAQDTAIDRMVALKVLLPHYAQDRTFNQRFRREARGAARLDRNNCWPRGDIINNLRSFRRDVAAWAHTTTPVCTQ
jgi:serine/threonine-protein kinase